MATSRSPQKVLVRFQKPIMPRKWVYACAVPFRDRKVNWRVYAQQCNYSSFNGGHYTPSDYSGVMCLACGRHWRTKAKYVASIPLLERKLEVGT